MGRKGGGERMKKNLLHNGKGRYVVGCFARPPKAPIEPIRKRRRDGKRERGASSWLVWVCDLLLLLLRRGKKIREKEDELISLTTSCF